MAFPEHLTQRDECEPLTVKPVLFTLDLSNSVKQISPSSDKAKERVILKTKCVHWISPLNELQVAWLT